MALAESAARLIVSFVIANYMIQPVIRIGKKAIESILQMFNSLFLGKSVRSDIEFDTARDKQAIFFINGVGKLFGHH